ncbi:MAG: response regulator [Leptospiraceae bacterium]|nr:response regulator [Leptospiraceae bacterium]
MHRKDILVVDDEQSQLLVLQRFLQASGFHVRSAGDGESALALLQADPSTVLMLDLKMPGMGGQALIDAVQALPIVQPVILVMTASDDASTIIGTMKKGVYDYLIKPIKRQDLLFRVERAFAHFHTEYVLAQIEQEKLLKLEQQQKWTQYLGELQRRPAHKQQIFKNLHTNFNQGGGFGALISLMEFVVADAKEEQGLFVYRVDPEIHRDMRRNLDFAARIMNHFHKLDALESGPLKGATGTVADFYAVLARVCAELKPYADLDQSRILLNDPSAGLGRHTIYWDRELFYQCIYEVIINALKFSPPESEIVVLLKIVGDHVVLNVLNPPPLNPMGESPVIPQDAWHLLKEPFFRIHKHLNEKYNTMDFGLGLPLVDQTMRRYKGSLEIGTLSDHASNADGVTRVISVELGLPLSD